MNRAIVTLVVIAASVSGCSRSSAAQRANPAAVWCLEQGGVRIPVTTPQGVRSDCKLSDGTQVDEWTLFHRAHGAG